MIDKQTLKQQYLEKNSREFTDENYDSFIFLCDVTDAKGETYTELANDIIAKFECGLTDAQNAKLLIGAAKLGLISVH